MASEADQAIDGLLERYLVLVDQYAALSASLSAAQQRTFHALARARFTVDRGGGVGRDQYDERMQASRRVVVSRPAAAPPTFAVTAEGRNAAGNNPLRWFGVLVPQALRDAQSEAVRTVEDILPRLASVQAEMAQVEIEVRRARKRRAKAISNRDLTHTNKNSGSGHNG
ncbi:hypothetical protein A9K55_008494 [Cordyceps militaris]|uniref:Vacuolar ATPase assembly protein VMA22 n=1 Tax=Cordyceps militaris TaxID=73501 RepID=A0A2H4SKL0_CORMI|nr:hypothetical protein A9K55_008494 [Cordyceps militaris]